MVKDNRAQKLKDTRNRSQQTHYRPKKHFYKVVITNIKHILVMQKHIPFGDKD